MKKKEFTNCTLLFKQILFADLFLFFFIQNFFLLLIWVLLHHLVEAGNLMTYYSLMFPSPLGTNFLSFH